MLSQAEMWEAIRNRNSDYDGIFFYGVKSTGIFCRPSCKSRQPLPENVVFFINPAAALNQGFRPCKRCHPELLETMLEPMREVVGRVKGILETEYENPGILKELPERVGVSPIYLQRTYKKLTGISLMSYLHKIRIQKAKELLINKALNHSEICFSLGFQSLSGFYALFREETGLAPGEFRKRRARAAEKLGGASDEAGV